MYDTILKEKEGTHVLDWFLMKVHHHPNQTVDDWVSLIKKKSRFVKNMVVVLIVIMLQPWETSMLVALALIESRTKHEDAIKFTGQK